MPNIKTVLSSLREETEERAQKLGAVTPALFYAFVLARRKAKVRVLNHLSGKTPAEIRLGRLIAFLTYPRP